MKIIIKNSPGKGRGVFANDDIAEEEVIEICPLILMDINEIQGVLERYIYEFKGEIAAVALGYGSLYNHTETPNSYFSFDYRKKVLIFRALRPIKKGEEITVDYGYTAEDKKRFSIKS